MRCKMKPNKRKALLFAFELRRSINEKNNAKSYRVLKIHKGVQAGEKPKGNSPISYSLGMGHAISIWAGKNEFFLIDEEARGALGK